MPLSQDRLDEIGNLALMGAQQNSERLSAMMGVRAAQTNPVEASSIGMLQQANTAGNSQTSALISALAAVFSNLSAATPKSGS